MISPGNRYRLMRAAFGTLFALWGVAALAQQPGFSNRNNALGTGYNEQNQIQYGAPSGTIDNNAPQQKADSTKKPKIRKPLESYFFDDSTRARSIFVWHPDLKYNEVKQSTIDTLIDGFQTDYPYQRLQGGIGSAYLGNLGGASIPLDAALRPDYRNFSFAQILDAYLVTPDRANFYNTKKPFTHLSYFFGGQKKRLEESLWATHAQQISPSTGMNIDYKSRGTRGTYTNQGARDKNLSLGFSHTGKKYSIHAGYIYNMASLKENGGILRDGDITDTVFDMPEVIDVYLTDAKNEYKNNVFYLTQSYGMPLRRLSDEDFSIAERSSVFIGHSFLYSRFWRKYTDTKSGMAKGEDVKPYYEHWYINPTASRDSTFESLLSNKVFVQLQPWDRNGVVGVINAGIGYDVHHYYQFAMQDYLFKNKGHNENSTYIYGSVEGKVRKYFSWRADAQYHPFGYRSQDMNIGGDISLSIFPKGHPVTLSGSIRLDRRTPGYWMDNYFSNHFAWSNSFEKETETRFSVTFSAPHIGVELGADQSITTNKIYFGADTLPAQHNGSVSVTGLYAKKDFRIGGLHLNHRVLLQFSSAQEVVPVPLASVYLSYFYEFNVVKGVLRLQIGLDGRYNTKYAGFGYNPAIGQFYNRREYDEDGKLLEVGGYPFIDLFAAAKWKRMRIFVKMQHLNDDLIGGRNYFSVAHYPLTKRFLKVGFSWSFYD